ncbi:MAG: hypothetical protein P4M14_03515 [Gammaproteobacteria bacterium]|nr:hypothetical protein [Gammaproteobacteria bacterium]
MKTKGMFVLLSMALFANSAWANITAQSLSLSTHDVCTKIEGLWAGSGTIKANIGPIPLTCHYAGSGNLSSNAMPNTFVMNILIRVESGLCPDNMRFILPGNCHDGIVDIKTERANLTGTIAPDADAAEISGTVLIPIMGRDVTATVEEMHLQKQ